MALPWIGKIFMAIISDNITCCGSRRKSYLIINSSIVIFSIILLMIWGVSIGKVFIMVCVIISQFGMTWNDAITDALIAQASRNDLVNGAANLNTVAVIAMALGGILACSGAGFIELSNDEELDPNIYFGTYLGLICILLIASIFMNSELEPELILHQREREKDRL
jgi:MFS family permease